MQTEALRANLERTAVDVEIPPRHRVLLEISAPLYGVHQDTERLLHEIHHTYVGWPDTLPELHRRAMDDVYLYNDSQQGPEGLAVYGELYLKAAREATPPGLRVDAVRYWLAFLTKVATTSGDRVADNLEAISSSLAAIHPLIAAEAQLAAAASPRLKQLVAALAGLDTGGAAAVAAAAGASLRNALEHVYALWLAAPDPAEWYRDLTGDAAPPRGVAAVSHPALEGNLAALRPGSAGDGPPLEALLAMPDHATIARAYLEAADEVGGEVDARTRWLCLVLGEELLAAVHERALWSLARSCNALVAEADRAQFERFVRDVFGALRAAGANSGAAHLDLVRRIGVAVLERARPNWAALLIEEILTLEFHRPRFEGFTEDWSVRVDPNHLRNIRTYLAIIGANPAAAGRLLAALVIHLDAGGVFMADTDLFQKDVSQLLAADIAPVYHQVRSLLRRLPVYYSEIGAEGELRDVSTRIDEIRSRRDPLCHFLRKQCHVESNPSLVTLVEEVARFWATGDAAPLLAFVPDELHPYLDIDTPLYQGLHAIFRRLAATEQGLDGLLAGPVAAVEGHLAAIDADAGDLEKAGLLFRLRHELARKYSLDHEDLFDRLRASMRFDRKTIDALERHLAAGRLEETIAGMLGLLEALRRIVLGSGPTEAVEDIYRKRHIGTGIPSMYGSYREARLDAVGLSFRIESLVGALFDRLVAEQPIEVLDLGTLQRVARWHALLARGLEVEGYRSPPVELGLSMLDDALALPRVSREQLVDAMRGITHSVHGIVRSRVLEVYGDLYETLGRRTGPSADDGAGDDAAVLRASEAFLRNVIAESMSLQRIDNLSAALLHVLNDRHREWMVEAGEHRADLAIEVVPIRRASSAPGPLHLGNKGAMLGRLAAIGFPVPRGFIIPTDLARARADGGAERDAPLPEDLIAQIRREVRTLERESGARFGDAGHPLLLSVRGGAPISMPGMLNTFLDVGITPDIVHGLAARTGSAWAAWDAYRRFLQFWGMSLGLERDLFDGLISDAKQRFSAAKKAALTAEQMALLAHEYRALLEDHGIAFTEDPFEQLLACVELVIASWDSAMARVYRAEMGIADGWGTAVIVQNMVYGNLDERSGTGVLLTSHPHRAGDAFELFGDFVIQGQGDDVVSGLVDTFPISEQQRLSGRHDAGSSLERGFPAIYAALDRLGRSLVEDRGWTHQEIEFTFEGDRAEDLYILQAREAVTDEPAEVAVFRSTSALARSRLAVGIGVSGGALSCRVALDEAEILRLRFEHPDDPVLLVRPDTVPDDIHLLLQADALLTAIGGATSHAAVVARRLGKTCVVGCRQLRVYEAEGRIEIAGTPVERGGWISISGLDGSVYSGRHEVEIGEASASAAAWIGAAQ